jgi:hypothetical protein
MEETSAAADLSALTGLPKGGPNSSTTSASNDFAALTGTTPVVSQKSPFREGYGPIDYGRKTVDLTNIYTDPIENYVSYGVPLNPYADWNDIRAKNQSTAEKIGRGALKMLTTTVGAVAENTIGVIGGLASLATGGTYADNAVGRSIDDMNEWMSTNLPHYYTNKELEPGRDISLNANFWTDKVANGLGYSLGSLATVWLTGGEGLIARGMGAGFKAAASAVEIGGTAKAISTGEKLRKIYEVSKMVKTGAKLEGQFQKFAGAAKFINATKHIEMGAMMSLAEASVEAREKSKMFREEMISEWENNNPGQEITEEARKAIEESAKALENTTFGLNMAVLMPTNLLMFGKSVLGAGSKKAMTNQLIKDGEGFVEASAKSGFGKAFAKANKFAKPIYENSITEAYQEGAQFLIGDAGIDYYRNKFDDGIADVSDSFVKGLENTFGTTEGLESILLGAITGGAMGGASTAFGAEAKQRKEMKANTEKLATILNSGSFADIFTDAKEKKELLQTITAMNAAHEMGNYKLADELRNNVYAIRAMQLQRLGAMDMGIDQLDDLAHMDEKTFMERGNYDMNVPLLEQTGGKTQLQVVEEAKDRLKQMGKISDSVDEIINVINPQKSGLPGLLQGKEGRKQAAMQNMYNQQLKSILMTKMVGIKQRDKEIQDALDEMQAVPGDERYTTEAVANPFFGYSLSKLVTLIKRNKINVDESGNINFPESLVDTAISDTDVLTKKEQAKEVEKLRKEKQEALDAALLKYSPNSETGFNVEEYTTEVEKIKNEYDTKIKSYQEESADKPISVPRLGQKAKTKEDEKFLTTLQQAFEESENFDYVNKQKFQNGFLNVLRAVQAREEAVAAFDELLKSPEKREFTMAAKEAAEKAAAVDKANKQADVVTSNAETSADILEILNDPNLTPEKQAAARKRYEELKKIEDEYYKDYDQLDTETLEQIQKEIDEGDEKLDAQKQLALRRLIAARKGLTLEEDQKIAETIGTKKANAKEAEDAVNGVSTPPEEEDAPDAAKNSYVNKFAIRSADGRQLRVNGVNYENTKLNPLEAIETEEGLVDQEVQPTESEQIAKLVELKETIGAAEDVRPLLEKIFKIVNEAEYEAWQETVDPAKLQEDLKELLSVVKTPDEAGAVISRYLMPQFLDFKITQLTAEAEQNKDAKRPSVVKSVTLTNEKGQEVVFSGETDQNLANELAEIIMLATASAGTINTLGISQVEAKAKAKIAYEALLRIQSNVEARTQINEKNATPATLTRAIKMYKDAMMQTLQQLSLLKEAYLRQGMSGTEYNEDSDVQKFKDLYKELKDQYSKFTTKLQQTTNTPATAEPSTEPVGEMTSEEEIAYEDERGRKEEEVNDLSSKIVNKNNQIAAEEAAIAAGVESPETKEKLETLQKELEVLKAQKEIAENELNKIKQDYEHRKSSKVSPDVQTPEGPEGPVEEQANREETPRDVQVPEESEPDVNDVPDSIIIGAEEIDNADFIESEGEEDGDVFTMDDFQDVEVEEEEEEEDYDIVEDDYEKPNPEQPVDSPDNGGAIAARLAKSQYEYEEGFDHVIVNDDGTTRPNPIFQERIPLIPNSKGGGYVKLRFKPHLLADALTSPIGTEISFEVRTDTKWYQEQLAADKITEGEEWKHVPIMVVIKTPSGKLERVGMLERYNPTKTETNFNRQDIYNGFINGKKVTSTIQGKRFSAAPNKKNQNIANAVTSDGENFFYNPIATVNGLDYIPTIAIARTVKGLPKWQVALEGDAVGENESVDTSTFSISTRELGSVAIVVKNPVGEFTHIKALTRILSPSAVNSVMEAATLNDSARVAAIVGFNLVKEGAINNENTDLIFQDTLNIGEGVTTYTFYLPSAESYIRISADNLQLALQKEPFQYSFVEAKKGEKGGINFEIDTTRKDWSTFYDDVIKSFKAAVSKRRFQVDANALAENEEVKFQSPVTGKVFDSYLDYLTDGEHIADLSEDFNGHPSILSVDTIFHPTNGSPFFDVGITYGPMLIDGKSQGAAPTAARKTSIAPKPNVITQQEEYEEDESVDEDDLDVDMSNIMFDEDEVGETPEVVLEEGRELSEEVEGASDFSKLLASETEEEEESDDINFDVEDPKDRKLSGKIAEEEEEEGVFINPIVELLNEIEPENTKVQMYADPVTGEETHYIIDGKKYPRITRLTSEPFVIKTEEDRIRQKNSSEAGTAIHFVVIENVLRGKQPKKPTNISPIAFLDLMSQARAIKNKIAKEGTVIATERVVNNIDLKGTDEKIEYAGRLDILVKLKNGKYRIIDIKTGSENTLEGYEKEKSFTDRKTNITTTSKSKRQQHGSQLSALAYALRNVAIRNKAKLDVQDGKVYFIPIEIEKSTGIVKKISKFDVKDFDLNFDIRKILKGELTFEQKIKDSAAAPEVKSAGKKKSSTKTADKGETVTTPKKRKRELELGDEEEETPKAKKKFVRDESDKINVEGTYKDQVVTAVLQFDAGIKTIMQIYKANNNPITEEEAKKIKEKILEENC